MIYFIKWRNNNIRGIILLFGEIMLEANEWTDEDTTTQDLLSKMVANKIEEVPKDKLTEREKYWINFYGSRDYGLNERCG